MTNSVRVFLNTAFLYGKMVVTTVIALYLTRVVLEYLGVNDFGIYNLIGGVIALLSFINSALMVSTQRFLSVGLGEKDSQKIKSTLSASILIHWGMAVVLALILELCSLFLFDGFLNIAPERLTAAKWVYQLMVLSTLITIVSVPYNAIINAREDLWFFSIVETVCAVLKLGVIVLFHCSKDDPLLLYTGWIVVITFLNLVIKYAWCKLKYGECKNIKYRIKGNGALIKSIMGFSGWNAFGTLALAGRNQGVAIILNIFWGTAINAVYGIANQVNGQLVYFSTMMTTSMTPQIMKSFGEKNYRRMLDLSVFTCKLAFLMSAIFAIPLLIEMDFVLKIWLKTVPEYTATFCSLIIFMFLLMQLCPGLNRAIQACGRIKSYQLLTVTALLLPIPVGYWLGKIGGDNTWILYAMIASQGIQVFITTFMAKKLVGLRATQFFWFVARAIAVFLAVYLAGRLLYSYSSAQLNEWVTFITVVLTTMSAFSATYFLFVFDRQDKDRIIGLVKSLIHRK